MANKSFNLEFNVSANIGPITTSLDKLKNSIKNLNVSDSVKKNFDSMTTALESEIKNFQSIVGKGFTNNKQIAEAETSFSKITKLINKINVETRSVSGIDPKRLLPPEIKKNFNDVITQINKIQNLKGNFALADEFNKLNEQIEEADQKVQKLFTSLGQTAKQLYKEEKEKTGKTTLTNEEKESIKANSEAYQDLINSYNKAKEAAASFKKQREEMKAAAAKEGKDIQQLGEDYKELGNDIEKNTERIKEKIIELAKQMHQELTLDDLKGLSLDALQAKLESFTTAPLTSGLKDAEKESTNLGKALDLPKQKLDQVSQSGKEISERAREVENLANQVKQFFSLGNTIQLFKRAVRSAFDTIKDLDAVMTQTAVVTDFTVGDMWAQLPEYTKRANELGVSVKGAYEAATLYYQQGLSTNEVIGVSNETLKMAKIAAIDYATATDYMTSALRGFNMEVNEQSAQKVNDIYSQLAAKTAADTEEISIAMSKTAPLAHNAGMEIETTAAFLAQAIETTREAPETIGTAMKTVIARFQELKKDPALIEPVDGEIVDANKIEGALRTIGVALRDTDGQFRDLDDVFLEISQKWNSLDTNTQRYIATIAAGSRQQSRFIAMMANYDRTMELVEMANTSAGASQQQFEKTLDSMQSKLDRLKNAWNEFTMGLANNSVIKTVVDLLTDLLNTINKISSGVSGNNGILKSLVDIGILAGGLKTARGIFNSFFGWLQGDADKTGKGIGGKLLSGLLGKGKGKEIAKEAAEDVAENLSNKVADVAKEKGGLLSSLLEINPKDSSISKWFDKINDKLDNRKKKYLESKRYDSGLDLISSALNMGEDKPLSWEEIFDITGLKEKKEKIDNVFDTLGKKIEGVKEVGEKAGTTLSRAFGLLPTPLKVAIPLAIALGVAVAGIAKGIKANSIESQIKKAEESTRLAEEAANQAKEAYDNLLSGRSNYNELQNNLNNLTYGTKAWKEALIEANGQVLELLQTFPQLAQYMTTGANGRLEISTEGWETVLKQQQDAIRRTTNDLIGSQIYRANLENEKLFKDLQKSSGIQRKGLLEELINQYENNAAFFAKDENGNYSKELENLSHTWGINPQKIYEAQNALREYEIAIQENGTTIESYVNSLISNNLDIENLSTQLTDSIKNAYNGKIGENYNRKIDTEAKKLSLTDREGTNYLDTILDEYGLEVTGGTSKKLQELYKYLANITGEEIDSGVLQNKEAMAEAIARMRFGDEIESGLNELAELAKSDFSGGIQQILDVFGGDLGRFESQEVEQLKSAFSEGKDITDAAKALNINQKTLEKTIMAMGYTMTDASGNIVADFESFRQAFLDGCIDLQEGIQQATNNLVENMSSVGLGNDAISLGLQGLTDLQKVTLSSFSDKIIGLDPDIQRKIYGQVINSIKSSGEATTELLNNIDFSKPIESIIALQEAANNGEKTLKELAETMLNLGQFSTEKAFQDFMMSDEYAEMEDSLKEFIETNGKISSKNIKDLAKENSKLNKLLQIETISANGLAKALTAVGNNDISFEQITTSMLKALSSTIDLDNELEELNDKFSNFDKGFDTNVNVENYQKILEELQTYVDNGELGNEQFKNLYEFIFGEGSWQEAVENDFNGLQNAINTKKQLFENDGLAFWDTFIQEMNSGEISIEGLKFDAEGNIEELKLTAEELKEALIEKMKLTPDEATAMLGVLKTYNPAAALKLDENNAQKEYEVWLTELEGNHKSFINKTTIVTQQQLELWSKLTGKNVTEIQNEIAKLNGDIKVVDWFSDEGVELYGQQLEQKMHDALTTENKEWNFEEDIGVQTTTDLSTGQVVKYVDYEVAIKYAQDNGLSIEQLNSLLEEKGVQVYNKEIGFKANTKDMEAALDTVTENKSAELEQKAQAAVDGVDTTAFTGKVQDAVATGADSGLQQAMDNFSPSTVTVPIDFDITGNSSGTITYSIAAAKGTTLNNPKVGKIANMGAETRNRNNKVTFAAKASGTDFGGLRHSEIALTGEEGYELAYDKNGAFLLGVNGPEVAELDKGTVIYPHDLSKKILGGYSKSIFPSYKTGTIPNYVDAPYRWTKSPLTSVLITSTDYSEAASNLESMAESAKELKETSEDITEEAEKWENTVDWLYNMTQKINQELRIRNKLEKQYNRALKTNTGTAEDLRRLTNQEIVSLKKRQDMQKEMIELRKKELHTYMMLNKEMMKYAIIDNWDDMTIHIAWDSINNITDKDEYDKAVDFLNRLEDVQKEIYDLEDDVEDIEDELIELKERGKEQYRDLEDRVLEALIAEQQEMIDKQEETIKAIGNAEKDLVDAIQKNIDKMRQDRDNEEKESSLAEKERRLAYLRQDTTGSNALEIKQLEKELEKEKQDYTDTLIDQAIKDMKEQADKASEQREKQIELLQEQLEWQKETGYWADEATRIVREGINSNDLYNTEMYRLLYKADGVGAMSNASQEWWKEELEKTVKEAYIYLNNVLEQKNNGADVIESMKQNSQSWNTVSSGEQSALHAENERLAREYEAATGEKLTYNSSEGAWYKENGQRLYTISKDEIAHDIVAKMKQNSNAWGSASETKQKELAAENEELARRLKKVLGQDIKKENGVWYIGGQELYKKYKRGGLADFTGPAWLDGSKSKPEMVLNAKDTENFIQLKDILSNLRSGIVGRNTQGGDWYFDIDINVDEIANDYDVDKVAARIKQSIYEETAYRNVNAINFLK